MTKLVGFAALSLFLATGSAFANQLTVDYITPFNFSNGLGAGGLQVGETVTVPVGMVELDSFALVYYDASQTPLYGQVQSWSGSAPGSTLFTSSAPINAPGSYDVISSYYAFAFTLDTPVAVTAGQQIFLSLVPGSGTFSGNMAYYGGDVYSGGQLYFDLGSGLTGFSPGHDTAFSATFGDGVTPEPGTAAMMLGGIALVGLGTRRFRKQNA